MKSVRCSPTSKDSREQLLPHAGYSALGLEIVDETGYVLLGESGDAPGPTLGWIATWDHTTGVTGALVPIVSGVGVTLQDLYALDATPDGTLIAYAAVSVLDVEFPVDYEWIVSIDPTTGALAKLVDITGATSYVDSISTDPTTGVTYVWVDEDDGLPQYIVADLDAGTYGPTIDMVGVNDDLGGGFMYGADFDTSGTLWFYYPSDTNVLASLTGSPSASVGAVSSGIYAGTVSDINLAYDPYVAPKAVLAETGSPVAGILAGGLALLGAGVLVHAVSRRRAV